MHDVQEVETHVRRKGKNGFDDRGPANRRYLQIASASSDSVCPVLAIIYVGSESEETIAANVLSERRYLHVAGKSRVILDGAVARRKRKVWAKVLSPP